MDEAISVVELPLFPLKAVLFPGQVLPLHIFEDRYRKMIRYCLAEDKPFGVLLIKHGEETGDGAEPYLVGTVARILESTHLPDGTMNIITVGTERFRVRNFIRDGDYLRGEVVTFPMPQPDRPELVASLAARVRQRVTSYIELIAKAAGLQIQIGDMPDMPQQIGYLAAVAMQIDNKEKQELLSSNSLDHILVADLTLLNRENALLTWMAGSKDWPASVQFGPSGTLLPN